jgi:hypothetical protein
MKIPYNGNRHGGLRFARTSREAFGSQIHFDTKRDPDWIVGACCIVAAAVFAALVFTGAA